MHANNLLALALSLLFVFCVLMTAEFMWRTKRQNSEMTRKFIHITVGSFAAFWPFYMGNRTIEVISLAFFITVFMSWKLNIFRAIHSIRRPTYGELFFALAIGLTALISPDKWVFAAAVLHMSLADGYAAVVGTRLGKKSIRYKVFGQCKSVAGTLTFAVISLAITVVYFALSGERDLWLLAAIPAGAALLENIGIGGTDNLLVPAYVAVILGSFALF